MKNLTLIIPAKDEADSLPQVLNEIKDYKCSVIVILEETDIKTINSIKDYNCKILHQSGRGFGNALIDGINNVETDYTCIFNADGSFDQNDLHKMYNLITNNDFIYASRYLPNASSDDDTLITFFGNKFFSKLGNLLFSLKIDDILYTYVMGKTRSFQNLQLKNFDFRFCVELPIKAKRNGNKYTNIGSHERKRLKGFKKVSEFKDGFFILIELLRLFLKRKN